MDTQEKATFEKVASEAGVSPFEAQRMQAVFEREGIKVNIAGEFKTPPFRVYGPEGLIHSNQPKDKLPESLLGLPSQTPTDDPNIGLDGFPGDPGTASPAPFVPPVLHPGVTGPGASDTGLNQPESGISALTTPHKTHTPAKTRAKRGKRTPAQTNTRLNKLSEKAKTRSEVAPEPKEGPVPTHPETLAQQREALQGSGPIEGHAQTNVAEDPSGDFTGTTSEDLVPGNETS